MLGGIDAAHVYIVCGYTDMRRSIDGLAAIIKQNFGCNPYDGSLFLFCGKRSDRIKGLLWDEDGFLLLYKRLDNGRFQWPRSEEEIQSLSNEQFVWLMQGLSIYQPKAIRKNTPTPLAVDYTDLKTGETMKRLPVMIQIAWFKLKYPESKIAVQVTKEKEYFVAKARIYANYKDPVDCYLSEASASRTYSEENPSVSPREWAQTAAIGIALRNAGFGLQFQIAGEVFDSITPNEFEQTPAKQSDTQNDLASTESTGPETDSSQNPESEYTAEEYTAELTDEEKLEKAYQTLCPITKYSGKTLAEVLTVDPHALVWVANKYKGNPEISEAAKLICEHALSENNE